MATVHVSNISQRTTEKEVKDFFSFCGKITDIKVTPASAASDSTLSATVTFERDSAAKTALLLDNTQLGDLPVKVESTASLDEITERSTTAHEADEDEIRQEDKPRTTVLAEYLSHGYVIGDNVLQKALDLDDKHGITTKFSTYLTQLDAKLHATDKARAVDNTYKVSDKGAQAYNVLGRYFESAINTPTGKKVRSFYDTGSKQVLDIHAEARRLADLRKPANCTCGGAEGKCQCPDGKCTCESCAKPGPHSSSNTSSQPTIPVGGESTFSEAQKQ